MTLGERILQLRKTNNLSQEQLAELVGVSRQAISKWETDQSSPEIEKILALSKVFSISTDELLGNDAIGDTGTSATPLSEMIRKRFDFSRWAKNLVALIDRKAILMMFTLACFIAMGVCAIVDYALNQEITWAAYPLLSVPMGWVILTPLLYKKYMVSLCALTVAATPFLYFLDKVTPAPEWFCKLGLPNAVIGIGFMWLMYLLFRFAKISIWYKAAITLFLSGVVVTPLTNHLVDRFVDKEPSFLNLFINTFSCLVVSALLGIIGSAQKKKAKSDTLEDPK